MWPCAWHATATFSHHTTHQSSIMHHTSSHTHTLKHQIITLKHQTITETYLVLHGADKHNVCVLLRPCVVMQQCTIMHYDAAAVPCTASYSSMMHWMSAALTHTLLPGIAVGSKPTANRNDTWTVSGPSSSKLASDMSSYRRQYVTSTTSWHGSTGTPMPGAGSVPAPSRDGKCDR